MHLPAATTIAAMLAASVAGLIAGMLVLHALGEPTPLG